MLRRQFLSLVLAAGRQERPNIVFILVDDLRFDELGCTGHPFAQTPNADRLAREGALFTNTFAATPLCSPSRASFLTGQYPHRHGIIDNTDRSPQSHALVTWPRVLHDNGYETAFLGKWHMGVDDSARPGFDHWVSFPGQGESFDPPLNVNGKPVRATGYITDILTDHAVSFVEQKRDKPFCLYLAHKAIHPNIAQGPDGRISRAGEADDFKVAARHRQLYDGLTPPRRGNYKAQPAGKPALQQNIPGLPPLSGNTATDDATILNRMRMMKAVDEGLGCVIETLERAALLDKTVIIFTSDHGYFYGEHCLNQERRLAYEETIRIPLLIRYPPAYRSRTRITAMTMATDLYAMCLRWGGVSVPAPPKRDAVLIECFSDTVFPRIRKMGYQAVRTRRWKYIHYQELEGADELYDLRDDPFELHNRIADPRVPKQRLETLLRQLRAN
ncbi:MAG: sulfatase-like hydrolase/transferase [Acidobacteria bacterium]|nr:sulfatase-like hydrolase/transferase [Acidobacteriota bacterium]